MWRRAFKEKSREISDCFIDGLDKVRGRSLKNHLKLLEEAPLCLSLLLWDI